MGSLAAAARTISKNRFSDPGYATANSASNCFSCSTSSGPPRKAVRSSSRVGIWASNTSQNACLYYFASKSNAIATRRRAPITSNCGPQPEVIFSARLADRTKSFPCSDGLIPSFERLGNLSATTGCFLLSDWKIERFPVVFPVRREFEQANEGAVAVAAAVTYRGASPSLRPAARARPQGQRRIHRPRCLLHHRELHRFGDQASWWAAVNVEPLPIALELWRRSQPFPLPQNVQLNSLENY